MNDTVTKLLADTAVSFFKKDEGMSTPVKILMGVAAFVVVAYLSYKAYKRAKILAKAKHERDLAKEALRQKELEWELAPINEDIEKKLEEIGRVKENIAEIDEDIEYLEEVYNYEEAKIGAIKNWDDMDSYLDKLRTDGFNGQG